MRIHDPCIIFVAAFLSMTAGHATNQPSMNTTEILGATVPPATTANSVQKEKMIQNLYHWLDGIGSKRIALNQQDINHYFASNIQYRVNGKVLARGLSEFTTRCNKLLAHNQTMRVLFPLDKMIVAGDNAAVFYQLDITNQYGSYRDRSAAFLTFQNGKITHWDTVVVHA